MPFEIKHPVGILAAKKTECVGPMDATIQEKLQFPSDINDIHVCQNEDNCYLLRTTVTNAKGIEEFLTKWTKESRVVWRVNKTCPSRNAAGLKNIYWKEFRCQNSNAKIAKKTKKFHKKHTDCPAYMTITIKKIPSRCRSRDKHLPKYPTIIKINNNHNHLIQHTDYLKNCPVSQETKMKFLKMFKKGHTVLSALNLHRIDLQGEYGNSIVFSEMDRSICPDNQWCYRLYTSFLANKEIIPDSDAECELEVTEALPDTSESPVIEIECDNSCDTSEKVDIYYTYSETECCPIENIIYDNNSPLKIEYVEDDNESITEADDSINSKEQRDPVFKQYTEQNVPHEQIDLHDGNNAVSSSDIYSPPTELTEQQIRDYVSPFAKFMTIKLRSAPELFAPAIEMFNSRLKFFENDLDISEALFKFGK